jgi:hypothetical protein
MAPLSPVQRAVPQGSALWTVWPVLGHRSGSSLRPLWEWWQARWRRSCVWDAVLGNDSAPFSERDRVDSPQPVHGVPLCGAVRTYPDCTCGKRHVSSRRPDDLEPTPLRSVGHVGTRNQKYRSLRG